MVKIVAEQDGPILGVHIAGPWATELIAEGYLSVNWEATPGRSRPADPRAPDAVRAVRRVGARAHRPQPARLTCRRSESSEEILVDVTMPQLGETVTEGTITTWFKQVGDTIDADEPLFEVSTDKVDSEVPRRSAGVVTEILVPEGETVEVGARLAVISDGPAPHRAPRARRRSRRSTRARTRRRASAGAGEPPAPAAPAAPPPATPPASAAAAARATAPRRRLPPRPPPGTAPTATASVDVADRAPADHRARPRSRRRSAAPAKAAASRATTCSTRHATAQPAPAARTAPAPTAPAPAPAPPRAAPHRRVSRRASATRSSRSTTSAAARPSTWCGRKATSAHVYTSVRVDFERIERVRRDAPGGVEGRGGLLAHVPPVHRPRVLATSCTTTRTSTRASTARRSSCTATSTSASRSTSTSRA